MRRALKKSVFWILVALTAAVVLLLSVNLVMNRLFYNPVKDTESLNVLRMTTQTLCPYVTDLYAGGTTSKGFSRYELPFYFDQQPPRLARVDSNSIFFSRGTAKAVTSSDDLASAPVLQSKFLSPVSEEDSKVQNGFDSTRRYNVKFALLKPMSTEAFVDKYKVLLSRKFTSEGKGGICWIPVQTNDNPDAVCLGMAGSLSSFFITASCKGYPAIYQNIDGDWTTYESRFIQIIQYLSKHEQTAEMYCASGLYGDIGNINYGNARSYINSNGVSCMGMAAILRGDILSDLTANDSNLVLIDLNEDS